jgi:peroxiredoxin
MEQPSIVGKKAKDFTLRDQNGQECRLSSFLGRRVLLSFHPLAWTPICAQQMKDLERNKKTFEKLNTVALGLSVDSVPCKSAWARSLRISKTPLPADFWPHGAVAKSFGILRPEGFSQRANILVDEKGKVIWVKVYPMKTLPDLGEVLAILQTGT